VDALAFASPRAAAVTVLPPDTSLVGPVHLQINRRVAFATGLIDFLRVVGKTVARFVVLGHSTLPISQSLTYVNDTWAIGSASGAKPTLDAGYNKMDLSNTALFRSKLIEPDKR
jgi:hypothetical protein